MQLEIPAIETEVDGALTKTEAPTNGNTQSESGVETNFIKEKLVVSGWGLIGTIIVAAFFIYCSYLPVYHTDIWGHVSYGQYILENGQLPVEDPYVELAAGVEMINNAWLSQLLYGWLVNLAGPEGISDGYAVICLLLLVTLAATYGLRTGNAAIGLVAAISAWAMITFRLAIVRPELLGELCFALLLLQVALSDRHRNNHENSSAYPIWMWLTVPLTFALWANLHGAYVIGFALLGAAVIGSFLEAAVQTRSAIGILKDKYFRADLLMVQLSLLAACINPYGIDLLLQTALFPTHPNLKTVLEWTPLEMMSLEGIPMAFSWICAAFLIRHSRVRFPIRDVVLLLLLSVAVCLRVRMIAWYSPVYFFVMAPHLFDACRQLGELQFINWARRRLQLMSQPSFHLALIAGFVCYLGFVFSPISRHAMGGQPRPLEQVLSKQTPHGVTEYFAKHPEHELIYAPQWWGDWINWKLQGQVEVFVSTNSIHLVPPEVWEHYMTISRGRPGMQRLLNRYRINTMVVSKDLQPGLAKMLRTNDEWKVAFEDDISLIFKRDSTASQSSATQH